MAEDENTSHREMICKSFTICQPTSTGTIADEPVINEMSGTEGRNRTGTPVKEPDFESGASTSSATPAFPSQEGRNHIVFLMERAR